MQPFPPFPAFTMIFASSTNIAIHSCRPQKSRPHKNPARREILRAQKNTKAALKFQDRRKTFSVSRKSQRC
jgi:hypothetical protein